VPLRYIVEITILLIIILFVARVTETYRYNSQVFIRIGLLYDTVCYLGSYEMIVCPYTVPPYEMYLLILVIVLLTCVWASSRKISLQSR